MVATIALLTAGFGWLIWLVALLIELDTGLPDGSACTGRTGDGYDSCLRQSEIGGLVVWSVTMGMAAIGLALLTRSRRWPREALGSRLATILALLGSASLAIANIVAWTRGADGQYYDGALGPVWWSAIMTVGLVGGALAGWLLPLGDDPTEAARVPVPTPEPVRSVRVVRAVAVVLAAMGGMVVLAGLMIFAFGSTLFGSDPTSIDWYNREVLETCDVPTDSTLVRTYVLPLTDDSGNRFRSMSYVYASPSPADQVAAFYDLDGPGIWTDVPPERACQFGNRPSVLVLSRWTAEQASPIDPSTETAGVTPDLVDGFWTGDGAEVTDVAEPPGDTRSFLRLRLAQREHDGLFG